jgi:hypothetical protein
MDDERLLDLRSDAQAAVQRAERVLEHHLHSGTLLPPRPPADGRHGRAINLHLPGIGRFEAQHQPPGGGFATATFADQAQGAAALQRAVAARAIGADGRLVGYAGGIDRKAALLELEGVWRPQG